MKVEIPHVEGCPGHAALLGRLPTLLSRAGVGAAIDIREIADPESAVRERFLGSPTLRVDGVDVDPGAARRTDFGVKCRLYPTNGPDAGRIPDDLILDALRHGRSPTP